MAAKVISSFKFPEFQYASVGVGVEEKYPQVFDDKDEAAENDEEDGMVATYKLVSVEKAKKIPKTYKYTKVSNGN
jgi:hypothetical protein